MQATHDMRAGAGWQRGYAPTVEPDFVAANELLEAHALNVVAAGRTKKRKVL
jgi:hypothetical protein